MTIQPSPALTMPSVQPRAEVRPASPRRNQETGLSLATPADISALPQVPGNPSQPAGARTLVSAQAQVAAQALAGPETVHKVTRNTDPEEFMKIAREAAALPKGDPRLHRLLDLLKQGMDLPSYAQDWERRRRYDGLSAAYMLVADRLRSEDLDFLAANLGKQFQLIRHFGVDAQHAPFAEVLGKAAPSMSAEDSARIRGQLRRDLREQRNERGAYAQALGAMATRLEPQDVNALEELIADRKKASNGWDDNDKHLRPAFAALKRILMQARDPRTQDEIAWAMQPYIWGQRLKPEEKDRLVGLAGASKNPDLRQETLENLPDSRIDDGLLSRVNKHYGQSVAQEIRQAVPGTPLHRLGQLLAAKGMAEKPEFRDKINLAELDRQINALAGAEPVKSRLESLRRITADNHGRQAVAEQVGYMTGGDFQRRLRLLPPDEARKLVQLELHQLAALAPDRVQEVADALAGRQILEQSAQQFQSADPGLQQKAVAVAMQQVPGYEAHLAGCSAPLAQVIARIPPGLTPEQTDERVIMELTALAVAAQQANKLDLVARFHQAQDFYKKVSAGGRGPAFVNAARLGLMAMNGCPDDPKEWAKASETVLKVGRDASEIAKLFRVPEAGKAMKFLKFLKVAGPASDLIGAGVSAVEMAQEFKQGDYVGGACKGVQTAAGVTGAVAGIAILAGCSGPAAPAVVLGATVVYFLAMGADALWGDSDEVSFLKGLGVYRGSLSTILHRTDRDRSVIALAGSSCIIDLEDIPGGPIETKNYGAPPLPRRLPAKPSPRPKRIRPSRPLMKPLPVNRAPSSTPTNPPNIEAITLTITLMAKATVQTATPPRQPGRRPRDPGQNSSQERATSSVPYARLPSNPQRGLLSHLEGHHPRTFIVE